VNLGSAVYETGVATQQTAASTGTTLTSWRRILLQRLIFAKLGQEILRSAHTMNLRIVLIDLVTPPPPPRTLKDYT
jgi:hypothetical protein